MTSLVSASLKLERAAQHLRALQESVTGYIASKPFVFEWAAPDVPQARAVVMRHKPGIPPIDSCLVGDWVHNLRCALDHAVWETSVLCGAPSSNKRLAFPGFGKFDGDVLKWLPESVQQACERLHANIDIQELLFADNVDKHRMVQVVFVQPIAFFEDPPGIHIEYTNEEWRDGAIVAKVTVLHGPTPAKPATPPRCEPGHRTL